MNSQNEVVAAGYLNKALYDLTTLVVGDSGRYFNADITRLYVTLADRLIELYVHNDVLSAITPRALFQEYRTLLTYEADIVRDWSSLEADTEQHINAIRRYVADNRVDTAEAEKQTSQIVSEVEDIKFSYWSRNNITTDETVAYVMRYDYMHCKLMLNDKVISTANLGSDQDEAIQEALRANGDTVQVKANVTSWKDKVKLPKDIRSVMIRTSDAGGGYKNFTIRPMLTQRMVDEYGIDTAALEQELAKLPTLSVRK